MTDFSVAEVAAGWGARPFIISSECTITYAEAASRIAVEARAPCAQIVPERTPADILRLLASLQVARRTLVLHPRSTEEERAHWSGWRGAAGDVGELCFTTSGSTGRPKAVRVCRSGLLAAAGGSAENLGWADDDRWLLTIPPAHIGGFSIIVRCLLAGAAVVLPDALEAGFRPDAFLEDVRRYRVTLASLVPTMALRLQGAGPWPDHLRAVLLGGAASPPELLCHAARVGWPLLTTYGLTEACAQVTTQPLGTVPDPSWGAGLPLAHGRVEVRDGSIFVAGPAVSPGYLDVRGEPSPARAGPWLETGDAGAWGDRGQLIVHGRGAEMIVTGGENVFPAEVEAALRLHPRVEDVCVVGLPDPEWGQVVAAAYVGDAAPEALAAWSAERLATFRRPRRWLLVPELPLGPSGKVHRTKVSGLFIRPTSAALRAPSRGRGEEGCG